MDETRTLNRSDDATHQIVAVGAVGGATVVELHGDIDLAVVEPPRDCMISGAEQVVWATPGVVDVSNRIVVDLHD